MSRISYVNGRYLPHGRAAVHIEDRGYQFSDGVYEVAAIRGGVLIDLEPHLARLDRSLNELRIERPVEYHVLAHIMREVARRNRVRDGIVYVQITRGVAPRDHPFPQAADSSLVVTARRQAPKTVLRERGVRVITLPDIRWKRRDIKSISLLPNVLAKQAAIEAGAYEAWLVEEDGTITEGAAVNAWIVTADKELVTRKPDHAILSGITRRAVQDLAARHGYRLVERPFTRDEAVSADEAFLTSTTSWVMPVVRIDDEAVADGCPGPLTRALQGLYDEHMDGS